MKRLRSLAGMLLVLGLLLLGITDRSTAEENKQLVNSVSRLAEAIEKGDTATAKKILGEFAKQKVAVDDLMDLFRPTIKGGIGIVGKGGIDKKIRDLTKTPPTAKQVQDEAEAMIKTARIMEGIAEAMPDLVPRGKLRQKTDWQQYVDDMKKASDNLARAYKDPKRTPKTIQKAAATLNDVCLKCHNDFN